MTLKRLIGFFQHIANREDSEGVTNAFRFKRILTSRKKGEFTATLYADNPSRSPDDRSGSLERSEERSEVPIVERSQRKRRQQRPRSPTWAEDDNVPDENNSQDEPDMGILTPENTPAPAINNESVQPLGRRGGRRAR